MENKRLFLCPLCYWQGTGRVGDNRMKPLRLVTNVIVVSGIAALLFTACSKGAQNAGSGSRQAESGHAAIKAPTTGSVPERVSSFWATTLPIIRKDATAGLTEEQYQARRLDLFSEWVGLQQANANAAQSSKDVSTATTRVLELIDHVYGFPGTPVAERAKERQNTERTEALIADIDRQMQDLK